jgi:pilus assembly protein FimV
MKKILRLPLALALALGASHAMALGLGQVQVKSNLNEPLLAEIPVLTSAPGEADALTVQLAPAETFARVGLQRPDALLLSSLKFDLVRGNAGDLLIRITTTERVSNPFVTLLLEADWGRGRMLREYTLLLDPPVMAPGAAAPAATAPVSEAAPVSAPESLPDSDAPAAAPPASRPAPGTTYVAGEVYGPVGEGEALWNIAMATRPDSSISVNQMMLALLRNNPDSFINQNINQLKSGAVLRIPSRDEIASVADREAASQVQEQTRSWRGDRAIPQPADSDGADRVASVASTTPGGRDSRLEIVPPRGDSPASASQSGSTVDGSGAELRAEAARAREQAEALAQENTELRSRVQELEDLRGDSERLLTLRSSELQALQQRLAELEAARSEDASAIPPPVETPAEADAGDAAEADPLVGSDATDGDAATDSAQPPLDDDLASPADDAADIDAGLGDPVAAEPVAAEPVRPVPVTTPEPAPAQPVTPVTPEPMPPRPAAAAWYQNYLLIGGLLLLVIGAVVFVLMRRRSAASGPESTSSIADEFDPATLGGAAPVYDEQEADSLDEEEQALLDDLAEQPDDLPRHLALVRHYYDRGDVSAFEGAAEAMYAQVYDPDDLAWKQVVAMGREILPDHPLFVSHAPTGDRESQAISWGDEPQPIPDDFAQDAPTDSDAVTARHTAYRWDDPAPDAAPVPAVPPASRPQAEEEFSFSPDPVSPPPATDLPDDVSADGDASLFEGDDAASTKLELARAYLDMGDVEGARGMLEEVAAEGNSGQRAEAKRLLDEIR